MKLFLVAGLLTAISLIGQGAFSQSDFRFRHYDTKNGMASETTENIVQDSLGFIWIQYYGGVSRFDGYNFKVYQFDPTDTTRSIRSGRVSHVLMDRSANIWVYRWAGGQGEHAIRYLVRYENSKDSFTKYRLDLKAPGFTAISFDPNDSTIWFAGASGTGLFSFNYKTNQTQNILNKNAESLMHASQNSFVGISDQGSFLLLGSETGLWKFSKHEKKFSRPDCNPKDTTFLYHSDIRVLFDSTISDGIWCRVANQVFHLDNNLSPGLKFTIPESIASNETSMDRSRDGGLWIATSNKGLFRFHPTKDSITNIASDPSDPYSLRSNWLNDVMVDRDDNIWACTQESGISVLRKQDLEFHNYKIGGFGSTTVYESNNRDYVVVARTDTYPPRAESVNELLIAPLPKGQLGSLDFETLKTTKPIMGEITSMQKGKNRFWISSYGHEIVGLPINIASGKITTGQVLTIRSDPKNPNTLSNNYIGPVLEDSKGNLWVGAGNGGLNKIRSEINYGSEGSVEKFIHSPTDSTTLYNNIVVNLLPDNQGSLWVLTYSGIDLLRNGRFEHIFSDGVPAAVFKSADSTIYVGTADGLYVKKDGVTSKAFQKNPHIKGAVLKIEMDTLGRLWLSSLEGITCYDPNEKIALHFNKEEGIDHTHGIIEQSSSGAFVTADIEGISVFDPLSLKINREKTFPVLTRLLINNMVPALARLPGNGHDYSIPKDISVLSELVIDHKHNNFSIEFSAMQMTAPDKNLYGHKLEGYDQDWIETGYKNRTATYTNLPAGDYTFRVRASNHHGVWSDQERTLKIKILPPPWRTTWAYAGYITLFVCALVFARKTIVQRERLKSNLKLEQVEREKEHIELEKAKEVDKMKSSFFANISHEFRTPLTLIKGPVQDMLEQFQNDPKLQAKLNLVQRNSDLLLKLINQLLDLAKLESGSLKVEKSEGDLNSFVSAVSSSFSSFAAQRNIQLTIHLPEKRFLASFDKDKLETILINLINNAIKFTPSGGRVSVHVSLGNSDHQPLDDRLVLIVTDNGIGIPEDQQSKIFERFHQVSQTHKEVGTGLGLSFVKELTALHNGTIEVKSQPGTGSEFKVILPIDLLHELSDTEAVKAIVVNPTRQINSISVVGEAGALPNVLVVEDNADLRSFIIDSLGKDFNFLEAADGKQGLDIAIRDVPDLIISDVMMPEMDGITMTAKIKRDIHTSHIPLILLTAKSTEDSKLSGLQSGADDYLTKPFNKNELLLKVRNGVARQMKLREKLRAELMSTAPKVEVLSADEQFLSDVKEGILKRLSDEQLSVESLADDMGMSRVQLYRKISGLTDMSVNELIRKLRLQRAAQLLGQNWGPVSQVAYEVGFSNLSYFSKIFKEEFGVLPSEYSAKVNSERL